MRRGMSFLLSDFESYRAEVEDIEIFGDDLFLLMSKASTEREGWIEATKGMAVTGGVILKTIIKSSDRGREASGSEALLFVPGVTLVDDLNESGEIIGRHLA